MSFKVVYNTHPLSEVETQSLLSNREELRLYLKSIPAKEVKAIQGMFPDEYKSILKSIVRHVFPDGANISFRREGQSLDYDHFLKDTARQDYIHTLPDTLKNSNITVEFNNGDAEKALFIKKYFDPNIQKDIWDLVIQHNNEIRTKFARKAGDGRRYVEGQILRQENQASGPRTPAGATEIASTPSELPGQQITTKKVRVNTVAPPLAEPLRQSARNYLEADKAYRASFRAPREEVAERMASTQKAKEEAREHFVDEAARFINTYGFEAFRSQMNDIAGPKAAELVNEISRSRGLGLESGRELSLTTQPRPKEPEGDE